MIDTRISESATLLDIVAEFPDCDGVIRSYDEQAGTCLLCNALFSTVAEVAEKYGLDADRLRTELEQAASRTCGETRGD